MVYGEIQADKTSPDRRMRRGRIQRQIQRTLNTAKFESIVITVGFDEEIEWSTLEERDRKVKNWETVLLKDFKESHDRILDELNLSHKKAYFKNNLENKDYRADPEELNLDQLDSIR